MQLRGGRNAAFDALNTFTRTRGELPGDATRPQTIGLNDSPVGLAAFQLDHDPKSYELIARAFVDRAEGGLTRDDILDNVTLFWLTNTGVSSSKAILGVPGGTAASPTSATSPFRWP